jgi:hypothetical protein
MPVEEVVEVIGLEPMNVSRLPGLVTFAALGHPRLF